MDGLGRPEAHRRVDRDRSRPGSAAHPGEPPRRPSTTDSPGGLRVEVSEDGRRWETAAVDDDCWPASTGGKGHPRIDDSGRVIVRFAPRTGRYLRLTETGAPIQDGWWNLSELFVYEVADVPGEADRRRERGARGRDAHPRSLDGRSHGAASPPRPHHHRAPARPGAVGRGLRRRQRRADRGPRVGGGASRLCVGAGQERLGHKAGLAPRPGTPRGRVAGGHAAERAPHGQSRRDVARAPAGGMGRGARPSGALRRGGGPPRPSGPGARSGSSGPLRPGARARGHRRADRGAARRDRAPRISLAPAVRPPPTTTASSCTSSDCPAAGTTTRSSAGTARPTGPRASASPRPSRSRCHRTPRLDATRCGWACGCPARGAGSSP